MENLRLSEEALDDLPPLDSEEPTPKPPRQRSARGKRNRPAARSSTSSSDGSSKEARLKAIRADLDATFVLLGTAATPFVPVTGATLVARGPQGSDIVINIARKNERVYQALLAVSQYAVYGELAMFIGALAIALTIDMGQTSPNSFIAQKMVGVDILSEVYGSQRSNGSVPPAAAAAPTGWETAPRS